MHNPKDDKSQSDASSLLNELESIKDLLDEDLAEIPLLEELVDDTPPLIIPPSKTSDALPGQQSLFESPGTKIKENTKASPSSENPFLPKHIRERLGNLNLNQNLDNTNPLSQSTLDKAKHSSTIKAEESIPQLDSTSGLNLSEEDQALINSLVDKFLPVIEMELRQQLAIRILKKSSART